MSKSFIKQWLPKVKKWSEMYHWVKDLDPKGEQATVNGRIGELLVSYFLFGENRLNWDIANPGQDDHVDIRWNGLDIDVKTCSFFKDPLLKEFTQARFNQTNKKLHYCLVSLNISKNKYTIQGFIPASKFLTDDYLVSDWKGLGPRFIAGQKDLSFTGFTQ